MLQSIAIGLSFVKLNADFERQLVPSRRTTANLQNLPEIKGDSHRVRVDLLDPTSGRPLNSWTFQNRDTITIGRSPESDVAISDPYVSRQHASLISRDGRWHLVSLGRNGVLVSNQLVTEQAAGIELVFRLGAHGPAVKFSVVSEAVEEDIGSTYHFAESTQPEVDEVWFELDENQIEREVNEVIESDYFQKLQELAKKMRSQRKEE